MPQPGLLTKWREDLRQEKASGKLVAPWSSGIGKSGPFVHSAEEISRLHSRFDDLEPTVDEELDYVRELTRHQKEIDETSRSMIAAPAEHPGGKLGKLAVLVCDSRDALTDEVVNRAFPDGYASHEDIGDCESGARFFIIPTSYCAREVFKIICSQEGDPVYINRSVLLATVRRFIAAPATIPRTDPGPAVAPAPPAAPLDDPGGKPEREPKEPGARHSPRPPRPGSWNDR